MKISAKVELSLWGILGIQAMCVIACPQNIASYRTAASTDLRQFQRKERAQGQGGVAAFKDKTELVTLNVAVTDPNGAFVPGLTSQDFDIFEDGVRQEIAFFSEEDVPLDIGIL